LINGPALASYEATDARCSPVVIRRAALGSRWGEFLRVRVGETASTIVGQAKLSVGGKAEKEKAFFVSGRDLVFDARWTNEKVEVASALPKGAVVELSLRDLTAAAGPCASLAFIVEQGAVVPDVDEAVWIASRAHTASPLSPTLSPAGGEGGRGTPRLQGGRAPRKTASRESEWARWVGRNADFDTGEWAPWPYASVHAAPTVGSPLAKGAWLAWKVQPASRQRVADGLAEKRKLGPLDSPEKMAKLVEVLRAEVGSDAAVAATLFRGLTPALSPLSQGEGEKMTMMLATAFSLGWPVPDLTELTSPFGMRTHPTLGGERLHTGLDLSVPEGTPIVATGPGVVVRAGFTAVNGRFVVIDHGFGVTTAYLHNSRVLVSEGQRVAAGDFVAESGNTGRSTGPHLHYQLELERQPVDPLYFRPLGLTPTRTARRQ
jgi:hypothetical protein